LKSAGLPTPALNQVEWHPKLYDLDLLKYCKDNKILLQAYSSLGSSKNGWLREDEEIGKIAKELGKSPSQVLLKWPLQSGIAIIPKASSKKHLEENINLDFEIPDDKMTQLNNFDQKKRVFWNPKEVAA
jgi:methylglyoxal/glyoxal reductase